LFYKKMPFTIHSVTKKPTKFVAHGKAVSSMAFKEYAPYRSRNIEEKLICSTKMPFTIQCNKETYTVCSALEGSK
jgi:hypothetical protein